MHVLISLLLGILFYSPVTSFLTEFSPNPSHVSSIYTGNGETPAYWRHYAKSQITKVLSKPDVVGVAKNVIFFLGDGMGIPTVTAGRILKGQVKGKSGEESVLSWENFPNTGLAKTYNQDHQTPDSAGTATAYLCGVKTNLGMIGVDASVHRGDCHRQHGHELTSILDWSLAEGKSVGVVTTTRVTHATPAGAYAHVADRNWEGDHYTADAERFGCKDIARQLVEDNPNIQVIMGGGRRFFLPYNVQDPESGSNSHYGRRDGKNLVQDWIDEKKARGVTNAYVWNATAFHNVDPANTDYLLGLFENSHMNYVLDRNDPHYEKAGEPTLAEMTEKAVQILQKNPKGYFLLVEGGKIDLAHHASKADKSLHEVLGLDEAVTKADQMTNENDTLIMVTADHSHTMVISGYPSRGNDILGLVDNGVGGVLLAEDGKPWTTILYGDGPQYTREDLTHVDTDEKEFQQHSGVPLSTETHGGEDVAVYARGPMAHLFKGVFEQNYIAHVMAFSSCVGEYKDSSECAQSLVHH